MVSPVMKSLSSSPITAFATSISPPQRPSGVASSTACFSSVLVSGGARMGPGATAELFGGSGDHRVARLRLPQIGLDGDRSPACLFHAGRGFLSLVARARVRKRHVGAAPRELFCHDAADAAAAGNERDFVEEV